MSNSHQRRFRSGRAATQAKPANSPSPLQRIGTLEQNQATLLAICERLEGRLRKIDRSVEALIRLAGADQVDAVEDRMDLESSDVAIDHALKTGRVVDVRFVTGPNDVVVGVHVLQDGKVVRPGRVMAEAKRFASTPTEDHPETTNPMLGREVGETVVLPSGDTFVLQRVLAPPPTVATNEAGVTNAAPEPPTSSDETPKEPESTNETSQS